MLELLERRRFHLDAADVEDERPEQDAPELVELVALEADKLVRQARGRPVRAGRALPHQRREAVPVPRGHGLGGRLRGPLQRWKIQCYQ